jgi:glycosyltransferase involved in cell wall biosynthesis
MNLKYLFVLDETYPPFRVDTTVLFGEELARRNHTIQWIFQSKDSLNKSQMLSWEGGDAWVIKNDNRSNLVSKVKKTLLGICRGISVFRIMNRNDWDFVQVRDLFLTGVMGLIAAKIYKKRFFFWLSFPMPEMHIYRAKNKYSQHPLYERIKGEIFSFLLYRILLVYSDHVFVQSDQMKKDLLEHGVDESKMTPVYMGISNSILNQYESFTKSTKTSNKKRIVYLGTLDQGRRLDFLVRVHAKVLEKEPSVELWFVGKGVIPGDEEILRNEAKRLGIEDSVIFTGYLPIDDALQHVVDADVGLSPYYPTFILNSTSPTKLIEYMALRCPVVANTHPEQSKILKESGAGLCVPWDEDAFVKAIISILRNPDESTKMGDRGREYVVKHRSYKNIAERLDRKYRELCQV